MAKSKSNPFAGRWRIIWMEQWDQGDVDAEIEGYFQIGPRNIGHFQFGYLRGEIDSRVTTREGKRCLEFTWEGDDEMEPVQGRGWAVIDSGELSGMIFIHYGDESAFKAQKIGKPGRTKGD